MADAPKEEKRYKPSPEQIKQLSRSRNVSEGEAWAFLESDTRDAKDMLAYLEYEGRQIPPDDPPREGEFRDIQPSQISPDIKPPGEFDDIRPIRTFDTVDGSAPKPDWTQTRKRGKKPPQPTRELRAWATKAKQPPHHRISRVVAGGLFALFFGSLIQALTLFGVITMNSGHIFMAVAFVAGALLLITEVLPVNPRKHKILSVVILGVVLLVIDIASALYASHQTQKAQGIQSPERRGGYIQVFDRQLLPLINQKTQIRSGTVNLQYQTKGDATVIGVVHRHMLYIAGTELSKDEIERLLESVRGVQYKKENEVYELQPDSPMQLTSSPSDDDGIQNFNQDFTQILGGKEILYSVIVFKYRDQDMPTGMIRITENCGWIRGDPKNTAWHNCWNRIYDAPLR